jgi:hypothetical protein
VRAASGADRERVQRVFLARARAATRVAARAAAGSHHGAGEPPAAAPLTRGILEHAGRGPAAADRVYLIDPLGNLMMSYAADARPKGMLEDLKKLLRLSHVG